jgi:hypothetical protein
MLRVGTRILVGFTFLLACAATFAQADFSADIVNLSAGGNTFQTKIFSTTGKLRFQGQDKSGRANSIMLVDLAKQTSIVLMPQQHLYVQEARAQIPGQGVAFFQPKDGEDACSEWQKMAQIEKEKCHKLGHEVLDGRDTVKYESKSAKGEIRNIWIDAELDFPVKWKGPVGTGELRNIKVSPQPVELFEIPPGYSQRTFGDGQKPKPSQP